MSSYVMTPMKNLLPTPANPEADSASQSGIKRRVEFNLSPVKSRKRVKQRRKDPFEMPENIDPNIFFSRYNEIIDAITYKHDNIVFVWSPSSAVTGDFISTLVNKNDKVIDTRDRWLPVSSRGAKMEWGGMTVFYEQEKDAIAAANDLPSQSKNIKTIRLSKIMNDLANIESGHPKYGSGYTTVTIQCEHRINSGNRRLIEHRLQQCGEMLRHRFKRRKCEVQYRFFTHAHLAAVAFHQTKKKSLGKISAVVNMSEKEEDMLDFLKENVMLHLEDSCFTR